MLFSMQAQVLRVYEIYEGDYITRHIKYGVPPASNKIYLGRPELYAAAQDYILQSWHRTMLFIYTRLHFLLHR